MYKRRNAHSKLERNKFLFSTNCDVIDVVRTHNNKFEAKANYIDRVGPLVASFGGHLN